MKFNFRFLLVSIALMCLSFVSHAVGSNLLVLVDPESEEATLIESLGYTPVDSMDLLTAMFDPNTCIIGIGHSGLSRTNWEWVNDHLHDNVALVGFQWDTADLIEDGEVPQATLMPELISMAYISDGELISYDMESAGELDGFIDWACFLVSDGTSEFDTSDFGFMNFDTMLEEMFAEARFALNFLDHFLQPDWEYRVVSVTADNLEATLNEFGADSWELISADGLNLIFKRRALNAERLMELILELTKEVMEEQLWL